MLAFQIVEQFTRFYIGVLIQNNRTNSEYILKHECASACMIVYVCALCVRMRARIDVLEWFAAVYAI